MLAQRLIVTILLIPIGVALIVLGGWGFAVATALIFGYAAWEYWRIFNRGGYQPSAPVLIAGVAGMVIARQMSGFAASGLILGLAVLLAMAEQIVRYEKGSNTSSLDFNVTLGGILYLGWLGAYFVSLRGLPDGQWWLLLVLPACWIGDGAAYFIGSHFGKHKLSPRVSPKKTWEGYLGGILFGALGTLLLAALWHLRAPGITPLRGFILGLAVCVIAPLGDLGESMLKRGFGVKDSGALLPGHGGILDRMDSWLWAVAIGYYLILWAL